MGTKLTVQIDASLVAKMRAKAIADGLPNARTMSNEDLLEALILALVGEGAGEPTTPNVVWVKSQYGLNLRAQPVSGAVLKTLDDGETLTVLGQQGDWLQVRTSDGATGWVATEYVTREKPSVPGEVVTPPSLGTVWVQPQDGLNLRAGPVSGTILRTLSQGDELSVLGRQGNWLRVRTSDGAVGWVAAEYVSEEKPTVPDFTPPAAKSNVRGIHGSAGMVAPPQHYWDNWISEIKAMGMAWYKQLDAGDPNDVGGSSTFAWATRLKQNGIEPIIRYYQGQMFPGRLQSRAFTKMERYAARGIVWCEIGNEPNLDHAEWHSNYHGKVSWQTPYYPKTIVENWINDAEKAVAAGARPGFYAFAPTDWGQHRPDAKLSSVMFYQRMFRHVAASPNLLDRFRRLFEPGKAWLAVHVSTYEFPVDYNPFPPNQPPWDMCLRGYEVPLNYMRDILGISGVVVMSTEGGVFCKDSTSMKGHERLSSHQEHAQRTVEMFDFIQKESPLQAMCPWLISNKHQAIGHQDDDWAHDGWYDGASPNFNPKPVVQAMKNTKPT